MTHSFPGHPAGAAGVALLLLRLAAAAMIVGSSIYGIGNSLYVPLAIVLAILSVLIFFGLGTRVAALIAAMIAMGAGLKFGDWSGAIIGIEALNLIAIALLGAGAYSIDAHLFGRRVIKLDN